LFWTEEAWPAVQAEERLASGEVPPESVYGLAMLATGDESEARAWAAAYAERAARDAVRRHLGQS
jgi:hypothetical protein